MQIGKIITREMSFMSFVDSKGKLLANRDLSGKITKATNIRNDLSLVIFFVSAFFVWHFSSLPPDIVERQKIS